MSHFGWSHIVRVGLVQAAIGAIVVMMTSVLNRLMVVELGLPATVPGILIALHFAVQLGFRPQVGHWSDRTGRRTPWIAAGIVLLAAAGIGAAAATAWMATHRSGGLIAATLAFALVGVGVSLAGTPLLALLAERVAPARRASGAAVVWLMMIAGFVVATIVASLLLEPFTYARMVRAVALISGGAAVVACLALAGLEGRASRAEVAPAGLALREAVATVWGEPTARLFAWFIFISMLGYSAQDLILEPFGGAVFGLTPAESTRMSGMHQGGMLVGMIVAALLSTRIGTLREWTAWGCAASAAAFAVLVATALAGDAGLLRATIPVLGLANGVFAVGAVGGMMGVSAARGAAQAGIRMGVFGAAQAIASAIGGSAGAAASDIARWVLGSTAGGYAVVFGIEAVLFGTAAVLALRSVPGGQRAPRAATAADPIQAALG